MANDTPIHEVAVSLQERRNKADRETGAPTETDSILSRDTRSLLMSFLSVEDKINVTQT